MRKGVRGLECSTLSARRKESDAIDASDSSGRKTGDIVIPVFERSIRCRGTERKGPVRDLWEAAMVVSSAVSLPLSSAYLQIGRKGSGTGTGE